MSRSVPKSATPIDAHVATRAELRRRELGLTQYALGVRLGTSYQQVHKYMTGVNRMTAGRLYQMATALDVPVAYFFEGL